MAAKAAESSRRQAGVAVGLCVLGHERVAGPDARRSARLGRCRRAWVAAGALSVLLVSFGCADAAKNTDVERFPPGSRPEALEPTSSVPGTSLGIEDSSEAVVAAYDAAMAAFDLAASDPVSPNHPALASTTVDPALSSVRDLAASWLGFGQALRYPAPSVHRIVVLDVQVNGETAVLESCNVDDGILYEPESGRTLNDTVTTARDRATMLRVEGVWKLSLREQLNKWDGVAGCAATGL